MGSQICLAGHLGLANSPYHKAIKKLADALLKATSGSIEMVIHPEGKMGSEKEMLAKLIDSSQNVMIGTSASLARYCPEMSVCDLPLIFKDRKHFYQVADDVLLHRFSKQLEKAGIRLLGILDGGVRDIFSRAKQIEHPSDLNGLTFRCLENPIHIHTYKTLGARTAFFNAKETFAAFEKGKIDGVDRSPSNYVDYGYYKIAPYFTKIGLFIVPAYLVVNDAWFRSLKPNVQDDLLYAAEQAAANERKQYSHADQKAEEFLKSLNIVAKQADIDAFYKATQPIREKFLNEFPTLAQVMNE